MTNQTSPDPSNQVGAVVGGKCIQDPSLLATVRCIKSRMGDALGDEEFTFFLLKQDLPTQEGFKFLCFHDRCITLEVPAQDASSWHQGSEWISREKENIATELARRHGLFLSEPPDASAAFVTSDPCAPGHHLQFWNRLETIIVAHPEFLKIRLYATGKNLPLRLDPDLLKDLSALYKHS